MQHIATLLGATGWLCLATLVVAIGHIGCYWLKFKNGQIFHAALVDVA